MNYYFDVLKKYAVFGGRATRKEYWMFVLWNVIVSIVLSIIVGMIGSATNNPGFASIVMGLYALALILPSLAVAARRLHDTGRSGWWLLIGLIPIIGAIILLVFMVMDSKPDNKYGPNPKGMSAPVVA
jgi:uncharacterized membrane protein YhaH (DUF805 family)